MVRILRLLSCSKNLFVVPGVFVVFERPIERGKPSGDDELGNNRLIPVLRASIYALGDESAVIDCIVVVDA
jgi:hypothetical protein